MLPLKLLSKAYLNHIEVKGDVGGLIWTTGPEDLDDGGRSRRSLVVLPVLWTSLVNIVFDVLAAVRYVLYSSIFTFYEILSSQNRNNITARSTDSTSA